MPIKFPGTRYKVEVVAAVTGVTSTVTVPKTAFYASFMVGAACKLGNASASATGIDIDADTWYHNFPVSDMTSMFFNEASGGAGVDEIQIIWTNGK